MIDITIDSESRGHRDAVSPKGAKSEMQVMPATARDPGYGIKPSNGTIADDARVGKQHLAAMMKVFGNDPEKAWAAYNWGPGNLEKAIKTHGDNWFDHAPHETQAYVAKNMIALRGGSEVHSSGPVAEDGLPGNGSVAPIDPETLARTMDDPAAIDDGHDIIDDLPPANREWLDQQNNVVDFVEKRAKAREQTPEEAPIEDVLTPAERQDMDASAPTRPLDNTGYEKFTPNSEHPAPVNDTAALEKDQNPPASGPIAGEQGPPQKIYTDNPKSPDGHEPVDPVDGTDPEGFDPSLAPQQRVAKAINEAYPALGRQEKLREEVRKVRTAKLADVSKKTSGEDRYHAKLSQLKGELPTTDFTSIRNHVSVDEINHLHDTIENYPTFTLYDKLHAQTGLAKLLHEQGGQIPTKGELELLRMVFPDIAKAVDKKVPFMDRLWEGIANAAGIPRALMSSADLSAPLRQGVFLVGHKSFYTSFGKMLKAFVREFGKEENTKAAFDADMHSITARPSYSKMEDAGLALTSEGKDLSKREEAFMSSWAEKIPGGVGRIVRASDRAYISFLNHLRADTFDAMVHSATEAGIETDTKFLKDVANFVNNATGRGNLDGLKALGITNQNGPMLATGLFSPRLIASRVNLLNPWTYLSPTIHPFVRKQAIKSLIGFSGMVATVLTIAKLGGADVETDPRHPDFGKIKNGNVRDDVTGGFSSYIRLVSTLIKGVSMNSDGKETELNTGKFGAPSRASVVGHFLRNKESPVFSFAHDWFDGQDTMGEKFSMKKEVKERVIPMLAQDTNDVLEEQGAKGLLHVPGDVFGTSVQVYKPREKKKKSGTDEFGFKNSPSTDEYGFKTSSKKEADWWEGLK